MFVDTITFTADRYIQYRAHYRADGTLDSRWAASGTWEDDEDGVVTRVWLDNHDDDDDTPEVETRINKRYLWADSSRNKLLMHHWSDAACTPSRPRSRHSARSTAVRRRHPTAPRAAGIRRRSAPRRPASAIIGRSTWPVPRLAGVPAPSGPPGGRQPARRRRPPALRRPSADRSGLDLPLDTRPQVATAPHSTAGSPIGSPLSPAQRSGPDLAWPDTPPWPAQRSASGDHALRHAGGRWRGANALCAGNPASPRDPRHPRRPPLSVPTHPARGRNT